MDIGISPVLFEAYLLFYYAHVFSSTVSHPR